MVKQKYIFTLEGIDTDKLDETYGFALLSNIGHPTAKKAPKRSTRIKDLILHQKTPEVFSFIDESRRLIKCKPSMVNITTGKPVNKVGFDECFWCRYKIPENVKAIGCPIKYVPDQAVKTYYSEMTKDMYTIKEFVTKNQSQKIENSGDSRFTVVKEHCYLTDGGFCSFNCCMAFIQANKHETIYRDSAILLLKMYNETYSEKIEKIEKAPHWRKRIESGGELTAEQYRKSFNKTSYIYHGMSTNWTCRPIATLWEEKIRF